MLDAKGVQSRAAFFQAIRSFFIDRCFLEVDTPIRQPLVIPEQNISHIPSAAQFLQSSPELYMKRLLAGCGRDIFQICRCFRHGECGRLHLEEFVMLEWYRVDADYFDLMSDCEDLLIFLQGAFSGEGLPVSLQQPWERLTVAEAFTRYSSVSVSDALQEDIFDELLVEKVEPHLGIECPTFLYDYPLALASLARQKTTEEGVAERFELYISGVELGNGFSELTDKKTQRQRFVEEYSRMEGECSGQKRLPEKFLAALDSLDRAAGIAMGLDRLLMLFWGENELKNVVTFSCEELDL